MTGFELPTSSIGSDYSANWATTTAQMPLKFYFTCIDWLLYNVASSINFVFR